MQELVARLELDHWAVKGGVNLRAYFGSVRYSEDIDLDVRPLKREAVRRQLKAILKPDGRFLRRLREAGIQEVRTNEKEISKDSDTTLRFKRQVVVGGVPYPTTVEVSFREPHSADRVEIAEVHPVVSGAYAGLIDELQAPHYSRQAALCQKLDALANRAAVQARDVFDICWLVRDELSDADADLIAQRLSVEILEGAKERAQEIPYKEYEDRVLEYLDPADSAPFSGEDAWAEQQLTVVDLADDLLRRISHQQTHGTPNTDH